MDPREFQALAKKLVTEAKPAEIRSAISRAYYAAYNFAVEILTDLGFAMPKNSKGHSAVQFRLQNSGDNNIVRVGSQLTDLYSKRIQADYRLNEKSAENQKVALVVIEQVERMIGVLEEGNRVGARRESIIEAIRSWEKSTGNR